MLRPSGLALRGALAFGLPVIAVFIADSVYARMTGEPHNYVYLAAGPLCGLIGGLAFGRRIGLALVLAVCFGTIGLMFSLQEAHSPLFSDVVWTGLVSAFLFWVAGGSAMLALPSHLRFNGAMMMAVPGLLAGLAFQFFYGPAHFLFDLGSRTWWVAMPWEHLILWLIAGAGSGWLFGLQHESRTFENARIWATASISCVLLPRLSDRSTSSVQSYLWGFLIHYRQPAPHPTGSGVGACSPSASPRSHPESVSDGAGR